MTPRLAGAVLPLVLVAHVAHARAGNSEPLDFSYRVQGDGRVAPLVFNDGNDIYIQPQHSQLAELRVLDAPFVQEGPYIVVRGLREHLTLAWNGAVTTVSYAHSGAGPARAAAPASHTGAVAPVPAAACKPVAETVEVTYPVAFAERSTKLSATFLEKLPEIVADAKTAAAVSVVGRPDVSDAQFAGRRAGKVRAALVAQGVPAALIRVEARDRAEQGTELVITRHRETKCADDGARGASAAASLQPAAPRGAAADGPHFQADAPANDPGSEPASAVSAHETDAPAAAAVDAVAEALAANPDPARPVSEEERREAIQQVIALVQAGKITESMGATLMLAAHSARSAGAAMSQALMSSAVRPALPATQTQPMASTTLTLLPSSSVRRALKTYLRDRGIDLDWQVEGDLIVEEFAEIAGKDMKDVIETALRRLGLRGRLVAGRRLIVETRG